MPTSSQSRILSAVDHQIAHHQQQQQANESSGQEGAITKPTNRISVNQLVVPETKRRASFGKNENDDDKRLLSSSNVNTRRPSTSKATDGAGQSRANHRNDTLQIPIVDLNTMTTLKSRPLTQTSEYRRGSFNNDDDGDDQNETEYQLKQVQTQTPPPTSMNTTFSDYEHRTDEEEGEEDENNPNFQRKSSLLNETARRLLVLGTIRPSKTFYKNLSDDDIDVLMEYFRRMRNINRRISSEEINQELKKQFVEYKPKMFYDSTLVTKRQVHQIEKLVEPYIEKIRAQEAELTKLENPLSFVIKSSDDETILITFPREYNDGLITLISKTDPTRKSQLITEVSSSKLFEDIKANALDISYFPGGINYDIPRDEIDESGQMKADTYETIKRRLQARKVWYFSGPPEKKPHALLAIIPLNFSLNIDHQRLLDAVYECLKTLPNNDNIDIKQRILSIEFLPLSCILDSFEISNQYIIECDTIETKQQLLNKTIKIQLNKQSVHIELQSYDDNMHKEYAKFIKAEKYRELVKNHEHAIKQTSHK